MKIAIIKLGALGDVVRTLAILPALKEKYPNSEIDWITKKPVNELLENHPDIKNILVLPTDPKEEYDILYNFDIDKEATDLAMKIKANKKLGFYEQNGYPAAFNIESEYYLNTMFDDDLKKSNKKTYQEMMFQAAELEYKKQMPAIYLTEKDKDYANKFVQSNNINTAKLIGVHLGASSRWPSKAWGEERIKEFIVKAKKKGYEILLFGGQSEIAKQASIIPEMEKSGIKVYQNNPYNSLSEFASLVNICKYIVCSDSLAIHIAVALKKPTIGLFFCTSPDEVESYGIMKKIVSLMLYNFFPEKMNVYNEELVNSITADQVLSEIEK